MGINGLKMVQRGRGTERRNEGPKSKATLAKYKGLLEEDSEDSEDYVPSEEEEDGDSLNGSLDLVDEGDIVDQSADEVDLVDENEAGPSKPAGRKSRKRKAPKPKATKAASKSDEENIWGPFDDDEDLNPEDFTFTRELKEADPPEGLLMDLLPFQRQFLSFALEQEYGPLKGGILADEVCCIYTDVSISLHWETRRCALLCRWEWERQFKRSV